MLRICNQTAKIFVDGAEETSAILPENVVIRPQKARIGTYNSATSGATIYIDEFVFRHSAGTGTPAVPTSCYLPYAGSSVSKRDFGTIKSLLHFDYPYFNEPNKGLDDEAGIETWRAASSKIKLYGSAIPKARDIHAKVRLQMPVFVWRRGNRDEHKWDMEHELQRRL